MYIKKKLLTNKDEPILLFAVNKFLFSKVVIMPNKSLVHITLVNEMVLL